tara:strand:- start:3822 stop:4715 length:894 start_codon:yes stop_codon:yes gene_type:complete
MSRTGSTLLVKAIRQYFKKYYEIELPVYSRKDIKRLFKHPDKQDGVNPEKGGWNKAKKSPFVAKMHIPFCYTHSNADDWSTLNRKKIDRDDVQKKIRQELYEAIDLVINCKRDIRDAAASEIISLRSLHRETVEEEFGKFSQEKNREVRSIMDILREEDESWNADDFPHQWNTWVYEEYKKDNIKMFTVIFDAVADTFNTKKLTDDEINSLLSDLAQPVDLGIIQEQGRAMTQRILDPEIWAKWDRDGGEKTWSGWNVGVSSTGGKVGYYKKFFHRKYITVMNRKYKDWLENNNYEI